MKRNKKNILKKVGTAILAVGVVAGLATGAKALYDYSHSELKTIYPGWNIGAINSSGKAVEDETKLYSNEFLCQGLEIKLDFENDINYQVFYYDDTGFLDSTEVMEGNYNIVDDEDVMIEEVTYARVMIIPKWTNVEATEDKTLEELQVVNWKNKHTFSSQLEIKVKRNQAKVLTFGLPSFDEDNGDFGETPATLKYEEGMTWEEWIASDYNTYNLTKSLTCPFEEFKEYTLGYSSNGDFVGVKLTDEVDGSKNYYFGQTR